MGNDNTLSYELDEGIELCCIPLTSIAGGGENV